MKKEIPREHFVQLRAVMREAAKDDALLDELLRDLFTPAEYAEMATRWQIVRLLTQGMTQREVCEKLHVSIETVSRGSRELADDKGGFQRLLDKVKY